MCNAYTFSSWCQKTLYRVTPDPKELLDTKFQESFVKFNDNLNLDRLIQPADPTEVYEMLNWEADVSTTPDDVAGGEGDSFFDFKS